MSETEFDEMGSTEEAKTFVEGLDFYFEDGLMVLTRRFLLDRGYCCESDCRHCPFEKPGGSK